MKLLLIVWLLPFLVSSQNTTLELLHILFRHGERSPSRTYRNDPNRDYQWPHGWNQLTKRGKLEMYELGAKFREIYNGFLKETYFPGDVYVLSSYADRCHMSAQLLLAGLYPPKNEQIWSENLAWQPIPINSLPRNLDNKIAQKKPCPSYEKALNEAYKSDKIKKIYEENKELFQMLSDNMGEEIRTIRTLEMLYNGLEIQKLNNLTLPAWTNGVFPGKMKDLAALSLAIFSDTQFLKRMSGGSLVKDIISNMQKKVNKTLEPSPDLFLYSGHDLTIVTILRTLGFEELRKPAFGASLILELHHKNPEGYLVKVIYRNSTHGATEVLNERSLDAFVRGLEEVIPEDWEKECVI